MKEKIALAVVIIIILIGLGYSAYENIYTANSFFRTIK